MYIFLYSLIFVLCIIGIFIKPKTNILQYIILMIICFLTGRGAITNDTPNYYYGYLITPYKSYSETYEPGYLLLTKIGYFLGANYVEFRTAIIFIALLLLHRLVNKVAGKNSYYFYIFYAMFLIFIDNEQHRSFLAFSLIACGISFLLFSKKIKGVFQYLFFVLIASTLHASSLLYLPLVLVKLNNQRKLSHFIAAFSLIGCLLIFFNIFSVSFITNIITNISDGAERTAAYGAVEVRFGFLYAFFLHSISIAILYKIYRMLYDKNRFYLNKGFDSSLVQYNIYIYKFILTLNIISIIYFPVYMFNLQFIRIARNIFLLNLIWFAASMFVFDKKYVKKYLILLMVIILILLWFYYTFIVSDHIEDVLMPFFDESTVLIS